MRSGVLLADIGNVGLIACAVIDTAAVISYAVLDSGDKRGRWWKTPFGLHLMCFMVAFAIVLDQSAIYLLTTTGPLLAVPPPGRPDWFAWERGLSFAVLIPLVLGWRLLFIVRPPSPRRRGKVRLHRQLRIAGEAQPGHALTLHRLHRHNLGVPALAAYPPLGHAEAPRHDPLPARVKGRRLCVHPGGCRRFASLRVPARAHSRIIPPTRRPVMKRALTPTLNPTGIGSAAAALYAAVVMIWNATHHQGVIDPQVIIAAVAAAGFLYSRFRVTPIADPRDGNGVPMIASSGILKPLAGQAYTPATGSAEPPQPPPGRASASPPASGA